VSVEDALRAQLDSAKLEPVPAPEGGPPGAFAQAVEAGLRVAEEEAQRRLRALVEAAKARIRAEQEATSLRLGRWLAQSKVPAAEAAKVLWRKRSSTRRLPLRSTAPPRAGPGGPHPAGVRRAQRAL